MMNRIKSLNVTYLPEEFECRVCRFTVNDHDKIALQVVPSLCFNTVFLRQVPLDKFICPKD